MSVVWPADSEPESGVFQEARVCRVCTDTHTRPSTLFATGTERLWRGLVASRTVLAHSARVGKVLDGNISPTSVLAVLFMFKMQ